VLAGGVYTIHVQASGLRFATGGADGQVKVWSMAAVVDVQKEKVGPLVLATLSDHSSTVNAVRFSKNGRYLASGACRAGRPQAAQDSVKGGGGPLLASPAGGSRVAFCRQGPSWQPVVSVFLSLRRLLLLPLT
jgi:hypothetical protein